MDAIATLVSSIFQKESLHDCSVEELESLARQYPYFTPAQFLLAEKLRSVDEDLYRKQLQKLALHFSNPLLLDYLLNEYDGVNVIDPDNKKEPVETTAPATEQQEIDLPSEQFIKSEPEIMGPIKEEMVESQIAEPEISGENNTEQADHIIEALPEEKVEAASVVEPIKEEMVELQIAEPENSRDSTTGETDHSIQAIPEEEVDASPGNTQPDDTAIAQSDEHLAEDQAETFIKETPDLHAAEFSATDEEKENEVHPIPALPDIQKEPTETGLTFEPYHTVDYFASQGIKFVPEEKPADRFGQQLKSFTEWLKTMKRLPAPEIKTADPSVEEKIQRLADHSITEGDVVTESMAEVWAKQGNKEKAIDIYNKLSLLNRDKSAYFASLIDQLKNS